MSKVTIRTKPPRDVYHRQSPYKTNRKRASSGSLYSYDDSDIAYRSAPEHSKRLLDTSNGSSARRLTRTNSASEMLTQNALNRPANIGNPKYKAQEDYYDEIQLLKKELRYVKEDKNNLQAKIRRLEEDNSRKCKEMDNLCDPNKNGDLRRTLANSSTPTANVVMNLKQRVFKLEAQLKQRETIVDEMRNDLRWTRGTELEIQNRALFNELEKFKLERLTFTQDNYMATLNEETKNALRKLETDKRELKIENEYLKKRVDELEQLDNSEHFSPRKRNGNAHRKTEDLKDLCEHYENEVEQLKDDLKRMRRERDRYRDKVDSNNEDLEEMKRERNQYYRQASFSSNSGTRRRNSSSSEDRSRHDLRRSNEKLGPRSSLNKWNNKKSSASSVSFRNSRRYEWTIDDENRVQNFRENRAAKVIQQGWRNYRRSRKYSRTNKSKEDIFSRHNSKINGLKSSIIHSPRTSQQRLGSKIDNFGSSISCNRFSPTNLASDAALKIVQASLRGYIDRAEIDRSSHRKSPRRTENDDDDIFVTSSYERKRESFHNNSRSHFEDFHDKSSSINRRSSSDIHRSSVIRVDNNNGSKQFLTNSQYKYDSTSRFSPNDEHSPVNRHHSSSPHVRQINGSKQSLIDGRDKLNSGIHLDRESSLKMNSELFGAFLPSGSTALSSLSSPSCSLLNPPRTSNLPSANKVAV
ncbi:unnamed protein product [Adineta ricciae]|uniref:Uncharacterized protein n=1 Tax=Adineta ricciae TaxID=249248 RepID=A0A815LEC5_ADIRI|nr:unnamed protein product [Adineta ricciae]